MYIHIHGRFIYIGLYRAYRRFRSYTCLHSYLALSRATFPESVKATELIHTWRGTTLFHSQGEVRSVTTVSCGLPARFPG